MGHLAKQRDASFFVLFFKTCQYGVLTFFRFISPSEKRKTAQDIVCFIYSLNKAHLRAHLCHQGSNNCWEEVQKVIKKWRIERDFKENI